MGQKKLLLVTDHRFFGSSAGIFDASCYDHHFFDDYIAVFDRVRVAARIRADARPAFSCRVDSAAVSFCPLPDRQGFHWVREPHCVSRALAEAVSWADAVCIRAPSVSGHIAFRIARRLGKPVMFELIGDPVAALQYQEHGLLKSLYGRYMGHCLRQVTHHAEVGNYVGRTLRQRYPPGPRTIADEISDVRLSVSLIKPAKRYDEIAGRLVVVLVASLVPVKRHEMLLQAVSSARASGANIHLHIVGDGPLRVKLERLAAALGMAETTIFHGQVAGRRPVFEILDASDLFVMTSASEGMPRAMIEAMARGLAVVGTDVGGIVELLPSAQRFPVDDCQALSHLLVRLSKSPELLAQFAAHSERMVHSFTDEHLSMRRRTLLRALKSKVIEPRPKLLVGITDPQSSILLRGQLAYLAQKGFQVRLLCSPGAMVRRLASDEQVNLTEIPMAREIRPAHDLAALWKILRVLRKERPWLVSAGTPKAGFLVALAAWFCRTPVRVYVLRGLRFETERGVRRGVLWLTERITCRVSTHILCNSHSLMRRAVEVGVFAKGRGTVLRAGSSNGVDTRRFRMTRAKREEGTHLRRTYGIGHDELVIGFVGRLVPDKGLLELAHAWRQLRVQFPGLHLFVLGAQETHSPLASDVHTMLHRDGRVHLAGHRDDPSPFYACMDLLVLPSYREGFPNVILEAASMGIPAVATDVPGCVDAVEDGVTGALIPVRDAAALERTIRKYLENPYLRRRHGHQARRRVRRDFRRELIWEDLHSLFVKLLQDQGLPAPGVPAPRHERGPRPSVPALVSVNR
ncbi:glycosyltransferase [Candidatus Nitrospira bockiana]